MKITPGYMQRILDKEQTNLEEFYESPLMEEEKTSTFKLATLVFSPIVITVAVASALYKFLRK